jgi:hypothetical protein
MPRSNSIPIGSFAVFSPAAFDVGRNGRNGRNRRGVGGAGAVGLRHCADPAPPC